MLAEQMAERPELAGEAFNFSNEIQVTVLELANLILRLVDRDDLELDVRAEARNEISHQYLDAAKARQTLGWKPRYNLEEGLMRTILWYRDYLKELKVTDADRVFS